MSDIGTIPCVANEEQIFTGIGNCNKQEGKPVALVISGVSAEYSSDQETFNADLSKYVNIDSSDIQKLHIIKGAVLTASNGGDITTSDAGYGSTVPVGYNSLSQTFRISNGGDCLAKQLAKFNKKHIRIFRIDDEDTIYGTAFEKLDKTVGFKGYDAYLMISETLADGTNPYILNLNVYYGPNYDKERRDRHAVTLDNIPDGLNGVVLKKGPNTGTARVINVCSNDDYTSKFSKLWDTSHFVNETTGEEPETLFYGESTGLLTFVPVGSYKVASAEKLSASNIIGLEGANKYTSLT